MFFITLVVGGASSAQAETLAAPVGGSAIQLSGGRVVCGTPSGGWTTDPQHHTLRPPDKAAAGARSDLVVATTTAECSKATAHITVIATGAWPAIEHSTLSLDDAALVIRGRHLASAQVIWRRGSDMGRATCELAEPDGTGERCLIAATSDPSAAWSWLPAGATGAADETLYDASGHVAASGVFALAIERIELAMVVRPDATIDAFASGAVVPLRHAGQIVAIDCAPAACVVDGDGLLVSNVPAGVSSLAVRIRLAPHVVLRHGDALETAPVVRIPIVRCPLAVISGPPLRAVSTQVLIVRVGGRCAHDLDRLRFQVDGTLAERVRDIVDGSAADVVLRIPRDDAGAFAITALSDQGDGVIAQVRPETRPPPVIHVALELDHHALDFIPTNVAATAHATSAEWNGSLSIEEIAGIYTVDPGDRVRGLASSDGVVALRIALHRQLPTPIGDVVIATLSDAIQRPLHEATTPAPLFGARPLAELMCDAGDGPHAIAPGDVAHVPFDHHDSCRVILHRERLDPAMGTQNLTLEVEVTRVDGSPRSEARITRRIRLAHDDSSRTLWLRGAESRFDRYTVRLSQDDDDRTRDDELPSAQWSIVAGRGRARVYATSAIPTGLYRVSDRDHSGILALNFGVLARATWLDPLGREGILCAETGVLTVGLANDTSPTGKSLSQVATVVGLGLSVPIANRALAAETSVNLHAWLEFEPSRALGSGTGSSLAFVFGPSITVGNLGADL